MYMHTLYALIKGNRLAHPFYFSGAGMKKLELLNPKAHSLFAIRQGHTDNDVEISTGRRM